MAEIFHLSPEQVDKLDMWTISGMIEVHNQIMEAKKDSGPDKM